MLIIIYATILVHAYFNNKFRNRVTLCEISWTGVIIKKYTYLVVVRKIYILQFSNFTLDLALAANANSTWVLRRHNIESNELRTGWFYNASSKKLYTLETTRMCAIRLAVDYSDWRFRTHSKAKLTSYLGLCVSWLLSSYNCSWSFTSAPRFYWTAANYISFQPLPSILRFVLSHTLPRFSSYLNSNAIF